MTGAAGSTMECVKCHTPLPDGSKFCLACGADVTGGGTLGAGTGTDGLMQRLQRLVEGKYRVDRMVGKGGMGAVFLAHDLTLEREVAIKVLPPDISMDEHIVKRFQQEAKTAAKLDHTNIIPIYRVESEGGLNYFVMKYIAGTSLEDVIDQKQQLAIDYIQRVLWEAACALGHAHQRSVVHRDVKPANIMFDHDGRVMLTDFGISKALQAASGFTGTGMIIGTPHYMAPEQAKGGTVDGRADQDSLGVVGYRLLAGGLALGAEKKKRWSGGMVVGALVVVLGGGYLALGRKSEAPPPAAPPPPQASLPPAAVPVETPRRVTDHRRQSAPPPAPPTAPVAAQGYVSVNSNPPGTLFIDGRALGSVRVMEEAGAAGRATIRVEPAGLQT